mmetsp:Transcript_28711/g.88776  ORF Transcript_28711/g.88776 Transcript_28711/m.88776 type:complete len:266 (+) Transcript_28711:193-990(+)
MQLPVRRAMAPRAGDHVGVLRQRPLRRPLRTRQKPADRREEAGPALRPRGRRRPRVGRRVFRDLRRIEPRGRLTGRLRGGDAHVRSPPKRRARGGAELPHVRGRARLAGPVPDRARAAPAGLGPGGRRLVRQPPGRGLVGGPRGHRHGHPGDAARRGLDAPQRADARRVRRVELPRARLDVARRRHPAGRARQRAHAPRALPRALAVPAVSRRIRRLVPRAHPRGVHGVPRRPRARARRGALRAAVGLVRRVDAVAAEPAAGVRR